MATRKRKSTPTRSGKLNLKGMVEDAKKPLMFLGGMFIAAQVGKLLDKNVTPTVSGILGLDGDTSKLVKPLVLVSGGLIASQMFPNQNMKLVGYGIAAGGGAMLAKDLLKIDVLPSLSGDDELPIAGQQPIPGIGDPNLPVLDEFSGINATEEEEVPIA